MTSLEPGNLVAYRGLTWAVMGFSPSGRGLPHNIRLSRPGSSRGGAPEGITAAPGDPVFHSRPIFEKGERVTVGGLDAVVTADDGGPTVACMTDRRKPLKGGGFLTFPETTTHADRASLVRENKVK